MIIIGSSSVNLGSLSIVDILGYLPNESRYVFYQASNIIFSVCLQNQLISAECSNLSNTEKSCMVPYYKQNNFLQIMKMNYKIETRLIS